MSSLWLTLMDKTGPILKKANLSVLEIDNSSLVTCGWPIFLAMSSANAPIRPALPPATTNWEEREREREREREEGGRERDRRVAQVDIHS